MVKMSSADFAFETIKPGAYHVRYLSDEMVTFDDKKNPGETYDKIRVTFEIQQGRQKGKTFTDLFTPYASEKSKLGKLVMALLNGDLPKDINDRDTEELYGLECVATVSVNNNGYNVCDSFAPIEDEEEEAAAPLRRQRQPVNEEPMPPALQQRRTAPVQDDFEIPEGFDTDAA